MKRYWKVTQGTSTAKVLGRYYEAARERARYIGFRNPESILLVEDSNEAMRNALCGQKASSQVWQFAHTAR